MSAVVALLAVPAQAGFVNLTTATVNGEVGTSQGTINDAIYVRGGFQPAGSGVIDSFVRVSAANQDVVSGINTDARPLSYDENTSPTFTRSLLLSAVPIVNIGGTAYREFMLDINQTGSDPLLSLDQVLIFQANAGNLNTSGRQLDAAEIGTGFNSIFGGNANLVYRMDTAGDASYVLLDYTLNSGSGQGDMYLYVKDSSFSSANPYVMLYSRFGETVPFVNNDGYEEWAVRGQSPTNPVPAPAGAVLALCGLVSVGGFSGLRRLRLRRAVAA